MLGLQCVQALLPNLRHSEKMKTLLLIGLLSLFIPSTVQSEPASKKIESIIAAIIPKGWSFRTDGGIIIGSVSKIKLLNPISLPAPSSEDSVWEKFSWESDFHVVIRITPKIDEKEYAALVKLRSDFLERRVRAFEKQSGENINGKSLFGLEQEVHSIVALPYCYSENQSIWITTTADGLLETRPKTAREFSDALRTALAKEFTLYEKKN